MAGPGEGHGAIEPPPTPWDLPDPRRAAPGEDLVGIGADLQPGTLLAAYRRGLFPMNVDTGGPLGWWSPDPRGILPLAQLRVSRSLRRSCRRFRVTIDTDFDRVIGACADVRRPHGWITPAIADAYRRLHRLGWAHSVEVWNARGEFAGGLYGVQVGGLFAGESMVHREADASKVALVALVDALLDAPARGGAADGGERLLDVQWCTDHLASLGAVAIPRGEYLDRLARAIDIPPAIPARGVIVG